jgi:hypothetical protein
MAKWLVYSKALVVPRLENGPASAQAFADKLNARLKSEGKKADAKIGKAPEPEMKTRASTAARVNRSMKRDAK